MVDDFMVCVDRIITSGACCESVNERNNSLLTGGQQVEVGKDMSSLKKIEMGFLTKTEKNGEVGCSKLVRECRICQEEDEEHNMEAPCACNGTLKFAHRKCVQRWCNKKGGITCEICNQNFTPNYASPPAKSKPDVMAIDISIRQAYPNFMAFATSERQFRVSQYQDYADASGGSISCFRNVAIILMLILLIHQALTVTRELGMVQESLTFFNVSLFQVAGFLLPCYVLARSWYIFQSRWRRQC